MLRRLRPVLIATLLAVAATVGIAAPAQANRQLESMFQDDNLLVYNTPEGTAQTMDTLQRLGVDRIRVSVFWKIVAPAADSPVRPFFDAADPNAYPPGAWDRYDQIVRLARARNIAVNFDVTSPAPNWATGSPARADIDETYDPSPTEYGLFLRALGTRYSGAWMAGGSYLPRVRYWSIWNEPNQAGWLTPQWGQDPRSPKDFVETAPRIYRGLVDAAWDALHATGHGADTILIGETAPKGLKKTKGETRAIDALRFIRQLYCLDDNLQVYQGTSAELRGCPVGPKALQDFPAQHPGLFQATGWAHHPYELIFSPHTKPTWKDWATIANLPDLATVLRRTYQRYRQPIPGGKKDVPLFLTEFGYQTNPPDPLAVSPAQQAAWDNESEYRAWADRDAQTLNQFLLVDDKPVPGIPTSKPDAWSTFQTGLLNLDGKPKPAYAAYAMPIYLPSRRVGASRRLRIWGLARPAPNGKRTRVTVLIRTGKSRRYQRAGSLPTDGNRGYVYGSIRVRRSGVVRLSWRDATGKTWRSRAVSFSVKR